ncbi:hypothetical protein D9611_012227 [Ephemerocybe angulata]|uniref:CsbD-like domain-containing protein n=1 Tax=Ephemerocybe angulata TaxID=980116 RepID=A0A8H5C580_9AGAR|nr:hypothetical protein D9611_012227 [Tulosesus angulatus]
MSSPSKTSGAFHEAKGNVKESIGSTFGSANMQQKGAAEHHAGEAEKNAARAQGYAEGAGDRVTGKKDQVIGAVTGDRSQEAAGNLRQEKGDKKQDVNRKLF